MAELDDLDDELDDDLDEGTGQLTGAAQASPVVTGFFSRKRILIIAGIVGAVFLIGSGFYFLSVRSKASTQLKGVSEAQAEKIQQEQGVSKSKKKKKIKYAPLFAQITAEQSMKVLRELSYAGISFNSIQSGKNFAVEVDEKKLEEAKNLLAMKGLPSGGPAGYELLDNSQTLGVTEFDKRVRFVRALSGELEKAINEYTSIESSKVQIVLPEQRLFSVTQPPVTTSVLLRTSPGSEMTDDIVFSIIQYVANAVENLQPENVTVVDTEGIVLSEGIFERMAAREAGLLVEDEPLPPEIPAGPSIDKGEPVIPAFDEIESWFSLKEKYEALLVKRLYQQLSGVLPIGGYKITVSADLGPMQDGEIGDIRRLLIGIVVDNTNPDIFLDPPLKQQIFNTAGAAAGYVKGRDSIVLTMADFSLFSEKERKAIEAMFEKPDSNFIVYLLLILLLSGAAWGGYKRFIKPPEPELIVPPSPKPARETASPLSSISAGMTVDQEEDRIRNVLSNNTDEVVRLIEKWMQEEKEEVSL